MIIPSIPNPPDTIESIPPILALFVIGNLPRTFPYSKYNMRVL
jgi:hypothetical protein